MPTCLLLGMAGGVAAGFWREDLGEHASGTLLGVLLCVVAPIIKRAYAFTQPGRRLR
jgi:hypothetical protein